VSVSIRQRKAAAVVRSVIRPRKRARATADIRNEIEDLARLIKNAKREIAALHPDDIRRKHLPSATDELDAIVAATAEATGVILDAAEKLQALGLGGSAGEQATEQVTRIFEACTFQDITGQRITKVVKTLKDIEEKVAEIVRVFGDAPSGPAPGGPAKPVGEAALLNGPQLPNNAFSQADIDALFDKA
jgi:chemotaxis protein CheZ